MLLRWKDTTLIVAARPCMLLVSLPQSLWVLVASTGEGRKEKRDRQSGKKKEQGKWGGEAAAKEVLDLGFVILYLNILFLP